MQVPMFIKEKKKSCGGPDCGTCASVCKNDCITYGKDRTPIFKLIDCTGCGECAESCFASQCIEMIDVGVVPKKPFWINPDIVPTFN